MIVYGYVKGYRYSGDGTLQIQVRVPNVHGAYQLADYKGKKVRNYTADADLPWYPSLLLPHLPGDGEVVALTSLDSSPSNWMVIGLTGGSYNAGATNL
jgi:hypothetical protein